MGTDDKMYRNGIEKDGNVRSECEKERALTVLMERVILIRKGR